MVVGGGTVARRKVDALVAGGAHVTVVAPDVDPAIQAGDTLTVHRRPFRPEDVTGAALVFACTNDRAVNAAVAHAARDAGAWVNVADDPEACTFFVAADVERGPLTIAVSTGGASPALARRIRAELDVRYGEAYGPFVELLGQLRREVLQRERDPERRRTLFTRMAALPCEDLYATGGVAAIESALRDVLAPVEVRE